MPQAQTILLKNQLATRMETIEMKKLYLIKEVNMTLVQAAYLRKQKEVRDNKNIYPMV